MLGWFERSAPIRVKFRVMLAVHLLLMATGLFATVVAAEWRIAAAPVLLAGLAMALTAGFVPPRPAPRTANHHAQVSTGNLALQPRADPEWAEF